ncbi:MAG: PIN domain-containing protein [Leptospiraceae bacterium]|nr:PIN domain-containing protein [Leptospiraceae bacterium]NUM42776.1 PIN domain-containing protein [Leptospiraceae bacterium]
MILDTTICIEAFRGNETDIDENKKVYIPIIAIGELYFGIYNFFRKHGNKKKYESELKKMEIFLRKDFLTFDQETANEYGIIKDQLRSKGLKVQENDVWISALAKSNNLKLLTKDKSFEDVEGLEVGFA